MSIMLLIGGETVGKLDEVGNWEVTIVEAVVIAEVTTAVSVVGSIGGSLLKLVGTTLIAIIFVGSRGDGMAWVKSQPVMGSAISHNHRNLVEIIKAFRLEWLDGSLELSDYN